MHKGTMLTLAMVVVVGCGGMEEEFEEVNNEVNNSEQAILSCRKCLVGTKKCVLNGVSTCMAMFGGCSNWGTPVACDHATESCSNGACIPSCPTGYTKQVRDCPSPGSTPCFKCCKYVGKVKQCYKSPTCNDAICPWTMCTCYHPGFTRATSCYLTYQYRVGWVWKCAMSDGSTCTYLYPSNALVSCS